MNKPDIDIIDAGPDLRVISLEGNKNMFYGFPYGSVMDAKSADAANQIMKKSRNSKLLECSLKGCTLRFNIIAQFCITGADMNWELDGTPVNRYTQIQTKKDSILKGKYALTGLRSYISFASEISETGAAFLNLKEKEEKNLVAAKFKMGFSVNHDLIIRKGPEWNLLTQESKELLIDFEGNISKDMSRMGVYLIGSALGLKVDFPKRSVCTFPGVIQLLPNGQLLVLGQDAQTTGGYPRVAYFDENNLSDLSQLPMGGKVKWRLIE